MTFFSKSITQQWNFPIAELVSWKERDLLIIPDYQREYVWNETQASLFIQAIFYKLPIPPIFITAISEEGFEIVDGLQRLTSIFNFIEGKLTLNDAVQPKLRGLDYQDLNEVHKRIFKISSIPVLEFHKNITEKQKLETFVLINKGGTRMTDEQLSIAINKIKLLNNV